jgi:hypothetical protein
MNETKLPPLEYQQLARAARLLDCEVEDLLHWAETGNIQLCARLNGKVLLYHRSGSERLSGERFARLLRRHEKQWGGPMWGMPFCLPSHPLSRVSFFTNPIEIKKFVPGPEIVESGGLAHCRCDVSGLWALIDGIGDNYFAVLQETGRLEIKAGCTFLPADFSAENPAHYYLGLINEPYDPDRIVLTVRVEDLLITRAQIEKIQNFQNKPLDTSEKPLGTTERNTLLKIIGGLAIAVYKIDIHAERMEKIGEMVTDLAGQGVSVSEKTLREKLKSAAELIEKNQ